MKQKTNNKKKRILLIGTFFILLVGWLLWGNLTIGITHYEIISDKLSVTFDGYKIAQISDFHNAQFGDHNAGIIQFLDKEQPDIIVITGDLVDSNRTDIDVAVDFLAQAMQIAPCYYVTGNHEAWIGTDYQQLEDRMIAAGVEVLHDEVISIKKNGDSMQLIGLDHPDFVDGDKTVQESILKIKLSDLKLKEGFRILLSHRPELFNAYSTTNMDLVLSGHAHGGQFRVPFIGGIVAPDQGLFPKYDAGVFAANGTTMVVSRGVGNSIIPIRLNNRPEIVIVKLKSSG